MIAEVKRSKESLMCLRLTVNNGWLKQFQRISQLKWDILLATLFKNMTFRNVSIVKSLMYLRFCSSQVVFASVLRKCSSKVFFAISLRKWCVSNKNRVKLGDVSKAMISSNWLKRFERIAVDNESSYNVLYLMSTFGLRKSRSQWSSKVVFASDVSTTR